MTGAQIFVTTHSQELAREVARHARVRTIPLVREEGATRIAGQRLDEEEEEGESPDED